MAQTRQFRPLPDNKTIMKGLRRMAKEQCRNDDFRHGYYTWKSIARDYQEQIDKLEHKPKVIYQPITRVASTKILTPVKTKPQGVDVSWISRDQKSSPQSTDATTDGKPSM